MSSSAKLVFSILMLCGLSATAQALMAVRPLPFACDPAAFTLTPEGDKLRLQGVLETPSPNYTYKMDGSDKAGHMQMTLVTPEEAQLAVIDKIDINELIDNTGLEHGLTVNIRKEFNWGPEKIVCKGTEAAQEK